MNHELPAPPFYLWQKVGFENAIYRVVGFRFHPGYQTYGWEYWLCVLHDGDMPSENHKFIAARDDQIMTLQALLAHRTEKAGKYAAETQRIAKEADAEHQRLMAQGMPKV